MITYSIIQKSQLSWENRIDAECYQPEYLQMEKTLSKLNCKEIVELSNSVINFGAYSLCNNISFLEDGIPFLVTEDINNNLIDDKNLHYISEEVHQILHKSRCKKNQVLLTMAGAYLGQAAVYDFNFVASSNQAIAKITLKDEGPDPYFLSTFLVSKYGQFQIERLKTVTGQPNINLGQIKKIKVPILDNQTQKSIKNIILLAKNILIESNNLIIQAENLLLEELGLKDYEIEDDLSFVVNLSDAKSANRIDAEYSQPKYERITNSFRKNSCVLRELAKRKTQVVKIATDENYKYIEISDINVGSSEVSCTSVMGKDLPVNAKMKINGGELIISKVRPTRGAISIIPENWGDSFIASSAFSIFEAPSPLREYLQVVLRSIVGKLQLEKPTTGTSYPTITDEDVEDLLIPVLPKETQQKIAGLVRKSHEARKKSKELLEEAKRKIEKIIEQGSSATD